MADTVTNFCKDQYFSVNGHHILPAGVDVTTLKTVDRQNICDLLKMTNYTLVIVRFFYRIFIYKYN